MLTHSSRYRSNRPTQRVQVGPRPLRSIDLEFERDRRVSLRNDDREGTKRRKKTNLLRQLLRHDVLRVENVQMSQVDENLPHRLVENDGIRLLHELSNDLSLVVLDDEHLSKSTRSRVSEPENWQRNGTSTHLLRLDHPLNHDETKIRENLRVDVLPLRSSSEHPSSSSSSDPEVQAHQRVDVGYRQL